MHNVLYLIIKTYCYKHILLWKKMKVDAQAK